MTAHAIYNDNKRLEANSHQVNTTMPLNSIDTLPRTQLNPTQQSSFSQSSKRVGDIFRSSWCQAAKSGFDDAKNQFLHEGGSSIKCPEPEMLAEMAGHTAAVQITREFHRDGKHASYLRQMTSAMGKPTTLTTKKDGTIINTTTIPTSHKKHRENNNRLSSDRPVIDLRSPPCLKAHENANELPDDDKVLSQENVELIANAISSQFDSYIDSISSSSVAKTGNATKSSPIDVDIQSNPTSALLSKRMFDPTSALPSKRMFDDYSDRSDIVSDYYTRMVDRSTLEEGCINVDESGDDDTTDVCHSATNDFARQRTANLIDQAPRVMNYIDSQVRAHDDTNLSSPQLIRKYD